MYKTITTILFVLLSTHILFAQEVYRTEPLNDKVHTLQVDKNGNWLALPIIDLNSNDYVRINFDLLSLSSNNLKYRIIHCNADWTPSKLMEIEYLDGFNDRLIDDFAESFNTTINYTNYNIELPNERQKLKLSGNYAVIVYAENDPDKELLRACFSVVDPQIQIVANVSSNTDIDTHKGHQQISFSIDHSNLNIRDVFSDLKIYVRQNNRRDNEVLVDKPTFVRNNELIYEHNRKLIFEAGNNYRRFESVSSKYNSINIEYTKFQHPYYYTTLQKDDARANKNYVYDKDQYGRYLIRNAESNGDPETDADYFITNFRLKADQPFLQPIYLNGEFTYDLFDNKYKMKYDPDKKEYYLTLTLKQGAYNYQYLAKEGDSYSTGLIEGNYYQTNNQYSILVYHRPMGYTSDLLIGALIFNEN